MLLPGTVNRACASAWWLDGMNAPDGTSGATFFVT